MSATLLTRVKNLLDASSLLTGYTVRYFRWTDADIDGNTPFILFRQSGGSESSILLQRPQVTITLVGTPTTVVDTDTRAQAIQRLLRTDSVVTGITRIDPIGEVAGPMYMENGRPVFEINCRVFVEDL